MIIQIFLVSLSMLLLVIALPLYLVAPSLAAPLYSLMGAYTQYVLNLTLNAPVYIDACCTLVPSPTFVLAYLSLLSLVGILLHYQLEQRQQEKLALAFC